MLVALGINCCFTARGELILSLYGGATFNQNTDLEFKQAGGTDLTFHDVSYSPINVRPYPPLVVVCRIQVLLCRS